jgi:hypothetical protein
MFVSKHITYIDIYIYIYYIYIYVFFFLSSFLFLDTLTRKLYSFSSSPSSVNLFGFLSDDMVRTSPSADDKRACRYGFGLQEGHQYWPGTCGGEDEKEEEEVP